MAASPSAANQVASVVANEKSTRAPVPFKSSVEAVLKAIRKDHQVDIAVSDTIKTRIANIINATLVSVMNDTMRQRGANNKSSTVAPKDVDLVICGRNGDLSKRYLQHVSIAQKLAENIQEAADGVKGDDARKRHRHNVVTQDLVYVHEFERFRAI